MSETWLSGWTRPISRAAGGVLALALVFALIPVRVGLAQDSSQRAVYFDQTGQTVRGAFYDAWHQLGGLRRVGLPVSQPAQQGSVWVQWFEFARLEVEAPALEQASAVDVRSVAVGQRTADALGWTRWHGSFRPVSGTFGPETRVMENGHTLANAFRATWEQDTNGERLGLPISQEFGIDDTVYQFFERGALSWHPDFGTSFVPLGRLDAALSSSLRLTGDRPEGVASYAEALATAAPVYPGERWIDINLSSYMLTAYEGSTPVLSAPVVDGAPQTPTARGTFYVNTKLVSQTMRGRNVDGSEYVTEDVPWVMYFYADFAIHGAYWRSTFGYSGSHGCVNLPVGSAAWLYDWTPYGTRVVVHD
jgi:hypothetical protein